MFETPKKIVRPLLEPNSSPHVSQYAALTTRPIKFNYADEWIWWLLAVARVSHSEQMLLAGKGLPKGEWIYYPSPVNKVFRPHPQNRGIFRPFPRETITVESLHFSLNSPFLFIAVTVDRRPFFDICFLFPFWGFVLIIFSTLGARFIASSLGFMSSCCNHWRGRLIMPAIYGVRLFSAIPINLIWRLKCPTSGNDFRNNHFLIS